MAGSQVSRVDEAKATGSRDSFLKAPSIVGFAGAPSGQFLMASCTVRPVSVKIPSTAAAKMSRSFMVSVSFVCPEALAVKEALKQRVREVTPFAVARRRAGGRQFHTG